MDKKKKKTEICSDCENQTQNFYKIPTNRGDLIKCRNCYELWVLRGTRKNSTPNPNITEAN